METAEDLVLNLKPLFRSRNIFRFLVAINIFALLVMIANDHWAAGILLFTLFYIGYKLAVIEESLERTVWDEFQKSLVVANGSKPFLSPGALKGVLGKMGDYQELSVYAEGLYDRYYVRLLSCSVHFDTKSKNGRFTRQYRVLEISTLQNFYNVFLDSKRNNQTQISTAMNVLSRSLKSNRTVSVEGDIHKYFTIYTPSSRSEGLVTLSPDKLIALRDYGSYFDVEFVENAIYLITRSKIRNIHDVLIYQKASIDLLNNIGSDIVRRRSDVKNSDKLTIETPSLLSF